MKSPTFPRFWLCLALAAGLTPPLLAASPRDELLRLVPGDVGVCVLVQDLRTYAAALAESPFLAKFKTSVVGKMLRTSPEMRKLGEAENVLKLQLDTDWAQLRDDILGDAVVMTYRPGPAGQSEQDQTLLLVRARNPALLAKLIDRLNEGQKRSGDLKELEERSHNDVKYYRRVEKKDVPYFYWVQGPVLAVSSHEELIRRVIDSDRQAASADVAVPILSQRLKELSPEKALLAVWFNPRIFEADLEKKAAEAQGAGAAFLKQFLTYWKAVDGLAFFVAPQQSLDVGMGIKARTEDLPKAARQYLATAAAPSELWNAFPEDALLAMAGRVDFAALVEMLADFLPPEGRKSLRDALERGAWPGVVPVGKDILPHLGPELGFCIAAPSAQEKSWLPTAIWALRVQPGPGQIPVGRLLLDGVNVLANLAVFDHNKKHKDQLSLKLTAQDKVEVRYFVSEKLPDVQPAYALKSGYLLFGSSPAVIERFKLAPGKVRDSDDIPLVRVSLAAAQEYLKQRRQPIVEWFVAKNDLSKAEVERRLDGVLTGLQFFQSVELSQRVGAGQAVFTLRVRTAQPLRK
jgi:hypothetical protein